MKNTTGEFKADLVTGMLNGSLSASSKAFFRIPSSSKRKKSGSNIKADHSSTIDLIL